mmetsp:Transcript_50794/g.91243  ORF Transcript_50794/g.91243 Transcript_50794/m.91243 type:complete len:619 (-) Transcript_50794:74-1930(-)|eukprot:CAMPEP_0197632108 /NCGR_PEP_ID=MMETSP1338-20131121/9016_1 /TAXON_ID=43686 ORGANISM="Pelagodinium beii, Strain RCC1491" /NCGR_SAMPLE_ID=MMETSP1338 /ASSEMBLY_ACC=CAM_ASM_000754 /LENGTH=618 /DNA_ID=CAMNT_0043203659 /DNA_START=140 /DNA_END=1996 /DNA_ORIENTATION=+
MRNESLLRVPEAGADPFAQVSSYAMGEPRVVGESTSNGGHFGARTSLPVPQRREEGSAEVHHWTTENLREGVTVSYYSTSHHNTYMKASVLKVYTDDSGAITKVDLDIKKKAAVNRIRPFEGNGQVDVQSRSDELVRSATSAETQSRSFTSGNPDSNPSSPLTPTSAARNRDSKFKVGDKVVYFSSSFNMSMQAVVKEVRQDGLYNLDVKKGATPERIKWLQEGEENVHSLSQRQEPIVERRSERRELPSPKQGVAVLGSPPSAEDGLNARSQSSPGATTPAAPATENGGPSLPPTSSARLPQSLAGPRLPVAGSREISQTTPVADSGSTTPVTTPVHSLFMGVGTEGRRPARPARPAQVLTSMDNGTTSGGAVGSRQGALDAGELQMVGSSFDPMQGALRSSILSKLGFSDASIEQMTGFSGGLNEGVWFVTGTRNGGREQLVLKLVKCTRIASNVPTEAENCEKVYRDHPEIAADTSVSFPLKIFSCMSNGTKRHDLIVMRRVPGERLAELICRKYYAKQEPLLAKIFDALGRQLAEFHSRYGNAQHGDFQPSNVFYDEARDALAFIDIGGMGIPCMDNDVAHFRKAMNLLANAYGPTLHSDLIAAFDRGYQRAGH